MSDYKVALMTGTGQGIGAGCAREMAKAGYMAVSFVWPVWSTNRTVFHIMQSQAFLCRK